MAKAGSSNGMALEHTLEREVRNEPKNSYIAGFDRGSRNGDRERCLKRWPWKMESSDRSIQTFLYS